MEVQQIKSELPQQQKDLYTLKMLEQSHQSINPTQLERNIRSIVNLQCETQVKIQLLKQHKALIQDNLNQQSNLAHLIKKLNCKNLKSTKLLKSEGAVYEKYLNNPRHSNISQMTADTETNHINFNPARASQNLPHSNHLQIQHHPFSGNVSISQSSYREQQEISQQQIQQKMLEQNIMSQEQKLVKRKNEHNELSQALEDKQDELIDMRSAVQASQKINKQKNVEIYKLQKKINEFSKQGLITPKQLGMVSTANLTAANITRVNTTILEDVQYTFRNFKDFLVKKIGRKNSGEENDPNHLNINNILSSCTVRSNNNTQNTPPIKNNQKKQFFVSSEKQEKSENDNNNQNNNNNNILQDI